jgi:predicted TIM-barrel fold metal-dependent hydrolase
MNNPPLVDAHAHVFRQDFPLVDNPARTPDYDFAEKQYLGVLDAHGVAFAVLSAGSLWGDYNDYIFETTRRNPRLRGTVSVRPDIERYVLDRMSDDGIVGIRLSFIGQKDRPDITAFEYRRLFRRVADLNWHAHIHVEGARLGEIIPMLENAGVRTVVDHLGRHDGPNGLRSEGFAEMLRAIERGRTWVKLSAPYRVGSSAQEQVSELLKCVGSDRLIWGSDCPFTGFESSQTYETALHWLDDVVTDVGDRRKIFGENALKLFFS